MPLPRSLHVDLSIRFRQVVSLRKDFFKQGLFRTWSHHVSREGGTLYMTIIDYLYLFAKGRLRGKDKLDKSGFEERLSFLVAVFHIPTFFLTIPTASFTSWSTKEGGLFACALSWNSAKQICCLWCSGDPKQRLGNCHRSCNWVEFLRQGHFLEDNTDLKYMHKYVHIAKHEWFIWELVPQKCCHQTSAQHSLNVKHCFAHEDIPWVQSPNAKPAWNTLKASKWHSPFSWTSHLSILPWRFADCTHPTSWPRWKPLQTKSVFSQKGMD